MFGSSLRVRRASDERRRVPASITFVSVEKETSARGRSSTKVAGTCLLVFVFPFWLLFSGVWETLIFGTGDWFAFGEPFFCGLFTPTYPLPGHRLVPESQKTSELVVCIFLVRGSGVFVTVSGLTLEFVGFV